MTQDSKYTGDTVDDSFVRPDEAARVLGYSRLIVYRMIKQGKLQSVKDGNRRLILRSSLTEYVNKLHKQATMMEAVSA